MECQIVEAPCGSAATYPFTPAVINPLLCMARTWNLGAGGQCAKRGTGGDGFCASHFKEERWRVHGRVDGPIPAKKLKDFESARKKGWGVPGANGATRQPVPRKPKAPGASPSSAAAGGASSGVSAEGAAAAAAALVALDEEEATDLEDVNVESDSDCELEFDLARSCRRGTGAVVGAEALSAFFAPAAQDLEETVAVDGKGKRKLRKQDTPDDAPLPDAKRRRPTGMGQSDATAKPQGLTSKHLQELDALCSEYGVPPAGRQRLQPLFVRWGQERAGQILDLWSVLGDGSSRPVGTSNVHIQGPQGTGKTSVLVDFLDTLRVRSVWLNCSSFTAIGELQARLVELLRRSALEAALVSDAPELSRELQHRPPQGKQLRALDRLELAHRPSMEYVHKAAGSRPGVQVVVVFDDADDMARLGANVPKLVASLPEVLKHGSRIACVTVSRMPLSSHNLLFVNDEPESVTFSSYTDEQTKSILYRILLRKMNLTAATDGRFLMTVVGTGLLKFAAPHLGRGMNELLKVGEEVLQDVAVFQKLRAAEKAADGATFMAALEQRVMQCVMSRVGFWDLRSFLSNSAPSSGCQWTEAESVKASTAAAMDQMTKGMKRLALSVYLAARIHRDNDGQLFVPKRQRRKPGRRGANPTKPRGHDADQPAQTRCPKPAPLTRVLAIYHHLAGQAQLLGETLFLHVARLREIGLLRLDRVTPDNDSKVICRVELPLARACAGELGVDLAEYLCSS